MASAEPKEPTVGVEEVSSSDSKESRKLGNIDEVQLPPERIWWLFAIFLLYIHVGALYALKLLFEGRVSLACVVTAVMLAYMGGLAVTIGAHRLWSHRSYKATTGLRYLLAIGQVFAVQGSLLQWVIWHRVHHKFSDTKLDPHNASRGLFYSHVGWLLMYNPKLYAIQRSYAKIEDLETDPVIMWQDRHYDLLLLFLSFVIPPLIPWLLFCEDFESAWYFTVCVRVVLCYHATFTVNSLAHKYGNKPYDKGIYPSENKLVVLLSVGEGWHNYHHTFPWDYRTSEFGGSLQQLNLSANIIDFFAKMGWAYDLKIATPAVVEARMKRTGEGHS